MTINTCYYKSLIAFFLVLYSIVYLCLVPSAPPDVDPINFVMGLNQFDVTTDRPHPPGYPLFVSMARVANYFVGEVFAYPVMNLMLLLGIAVAIYKVASDYKLPTVGLASICIIFTHPFLLSATLSGESYIADAFFGCVVLATIVHFQGKPKSQISYLFTIFFCLSLFRAVSSVELLPLALMSVFLCNERQYRFRALLFSFLSIAIAIGCAYLLTIYLAGGLKPYTEATARVMGMAFRSNSVIGGASYHSHLSMILKLYFWLFFISVPVFISLLLSAKKIISKKDSISFQSAPIFIFLAWVLPPLGLYTLFYFLKPTYLLIVLPPFTLAGCYYLHRMLQSTPRFLTVVSMIMLVQAGFFFLGNDALPKPLHRLTYDYIKNQDDLYQKLSVILTTENNKSAILIWDKASSLSIYATRLIEWRGVIVVPDDTSALAIDINRESLMDLQVSEVEPISMHWSPKRKLGTLWQDQKVILLHADANSITYKSY